MCSTAPADWAIETYKSFLKIKINQIIIINLKFFSKNMQCLFDGGVFAAYVIIVCKIRNDSSLKKLVYTHTHTHTHTYVYGIDNWPIILVGRVFVNFPGDRGSVPGRVIPYLPTPPLGQDMTQGQFLSGV